MSEASIAPMEEPLEANIDDGAGSMDTKSRSANINADPKMRELQHYTKSHRHEARMRESNELEQRAPQLGRQELRAEGCEVMDTEMKKLSKGQAVLPFVLKTNELPESFRASSKDELKDSMEARMTMLRRMDRFQTRLTWRESMDHSLKRLLVDMDLSRDERLKEYEVKRAAKMEDVAAQKEETPEPGKEEKKMRFAQARCEHLDKIYGWYLTHGRKEARKERKGPPYLRYDPQHPVMPGSMRVASLMLNKTSAPGQSGMGHSSSSPALLAAGSALAAAPGSAPAEPAVGPL